MTRFYTTREALQLLSDDLQRGEPATIHALAAEN
jgi:hypothetical protein